MARSFFNNKSLHIIAYWFVLGNNFFLKYKKYMNSRENILSARLGSGGNIRSNTIRCGSQAKRKRKHYFCKFFQCIVQKI